MRLLPARPLLRLLPAVLFAAGGLILTPTTRADVAGLGADLERLRGEAAALSRVLLIQGSSPAQLARFEIRIERLEEEIRRLTGRIERLEFEDRRLQDRIEQLVGDLDDRFRELEDRGGSPAAAAPEAGQGPPAQLGGGLPEVPLSQGGAPPVPPSRAPREGQLGTVPESAVSSLPRIDPSTATPPARSSLPPEEQYESAMRLLRAGDYAAAEGGLDLFLEMNPDHPLAANAAYWLAETHYVRRNYAAAAAAFARNYRTYGRDSAKSVDNLLKLGMSLQGLGESEKACLSYEELNREFANPPAHIQQAVDRERQRAGCG
jgi:tol-pal system protein YbgF